MKPTVRRARSTCANDRIHFDAIALVAWILSMLVNASAAQAVANVANLPEVFRVSWNPFNSCVDSFRTTDTSPFGLNMCCGVALGACEATCEAEHPDDYAASEPCLLACTDAYNWCSRNEYVNGVSTGTPGFYEPALVPEIDGDPRADYCLDGDTGCGAPAAHAFCERYEGPGHAALTFAGDGMTTELDDATWQLGAWYPRQPYGTGQGFSFIQCVATTRLFTSFDVPYDSDDDGRTDVDDNCVHVPNPFQGNADGDLFGDLCDVDPSYAYACSNGVDDDGDGFADDDDPGCLDIFDDDERASHLACDDGVDNDADGLVDLADPNCTGPDDVDESPGACENGLDDDRDGLVDLEDPGCGDPADPSELGEQWGTTSNNQAVELGLADFDGDGRDDAFKVLDSGTSLLVRVALSTVDGLGPQQTWYEFSSFGWGAPSLGTYFLEDVDGDGRTDLVRLGGGAAKIYRSDGTRFLARETWASDLQSYGEQSWMLDVTGDGRPDLVELDDAGVFVSVNTGAAFGPAELWSAEPLTQTVLLDGSNWVFQPARLFADVDGDGRADLLRVEWEGTWVGLNTGEDFAPAELWAPEFGRRSGWGDFQWPLHLADMNGDGRADLVGFSAVGVVVALSDGTDFGPAQDWLPEVRTGFYEDWSYWQHPGFVEDLDGDGRADFLGLGPQGVVAALSTGSGFSELIQLGYGLTVLDGWGVSFSELRALADVDGDGQSEIVGIRQDGTFVGEIVLPDPTPLPEPAVANGLVAGLGLLGALARRRRNRRGVPAVEQPIPRILFGSDRLRARQLHEVRNSHVQSHHDRLRRRRGLQALLRCRAGRPGSRSWRHGRSGQVLLPHFHRRVRDHEADQRRAGDPRQRQHDRLRRQEPGSCRRLARRRPRPWRQHL